MSKTGGGREARGEGGRRTEAGRQDGRQEGRGRGGRQEEIGWERQGRRKYKVEEGRIGWGWERKGEGQSGVCEVAVGELREGGRSDGSPKKGAGRAVGFKGVRVNCPLPAPCTAPGHDLFVK